MEMILAIAVAAAVIFFGALISMGNERQRKAIDDLREQSVLWAVQDLKIKRERLARNVKVDNPVDWLNKIVTKICGFNLKLQVAESFDDPRALICIAGDGGNRVVFTTFSPDQIHHFKKEKRGRLSQSMENPIFAIPRHAKTYEFSTLNCGIVFDLELPLAWNSLTGQRVDQMERVWMYMIS